MRTMPETAAYLRAQALKCRSLARGTLDPRVADVLRQMALEYDQKAAVVEANSKAGEKPD